LVFIKPFFKVTLWPLQTKTYSSVVAQRSSSARDDVYHQYFSSNGARG